jgi:phospholipase C
MRTPRLARSRRFTLATCVAATLLATTTSTIKASTAGADGAMPRPDHIVIVMMENKDQDDVIGSSNAPYLNSLASQGANIRESYAVTHPSQPNYVALFSGSTQGVTNDDCPQQLSAPNLGSELMSAGLSFAGFAEDMPEEGSTVCDSGSYARKHNPWVDFDNIPASSNRTWYEFPTDYSQLPTVSMVIPNLCQDMHDCSVKTGDGFMSERMDAYAQWAVQNNSLLIVQWDENNDGSDGDRIPTIIYGAHVAPGTYANWIDHYSILRTIEDMYGLPVLGEAANRLPISFCWS